MFRHLHVGSVYDSKSMLTWRHPELFTNSLGCVLYNEFLAQVSQRKVLWNWKQLQNRA